MSELSTLTWQEVLFFVLQTAYFFLPAAAANMAPVIAAKLVPGNWPIWEERLGRNKTWRGLVFGIIAAGVVFWVQKDLMLTRAGSALSVLNYQKESVIVMAFLFGGGALLGDAFKSLLKRRIPKGKNWPSLRPVPISERKYPDGAKWPVFDQIDFIGGSFAMVSIVYFPGWDMLVVGMLLAALITPTLNVIFHKMGWKEKPH